MVCYQAGTASQKRFKYARTGRIRELIITATEDRIIEVVCFALIHSDAEACTAFSISPETLGRYKRDYKNALGYETEVIKLLKEIGSQYSKKELQAIAKGGSISAPIRRIPRIDFDGEHIKFGFLSDTHIGSLFFKEDLLLQAFEEFKKEKVEFICHAGDVSEGMSNRPGHIYELSQFGYDQQKEECLRLLKQWEGPWYLCDGNHDRWFIKSSGSIIVKDICKELDKAEFLGHDNGQIFLNGVQVMLWHGEDSNSYAISYRLQKIVEAFSGGTKPNLLLAGHTHKQGYFFERNIHVISGGCIQLQTDWMKGKRIAAHPGFWIIDIWIGKNSINKICPTWYPFYL